MEGRDETVVAKTDLSGNGSDGKEAEADEMPYRQASRCRESDTDPVVVSSVFAKADFSFARTSDNTDAASR